MSEYGYKVEVSEGYDEAIVRTRLALRTEGFSILTEMHVGGLLDPKAGAGRQYLFMGVWNPTLSQERIETDLQVAVHLPCNVVIQETGSSAIVAALDPADDADVSDPGTEQVTDAARDALNRVLSIVSGPV